MLSPRAKRAEDLYEKYLAGPDAEKEREEFVTRARVANAGMLRRLWAGANANPRTSRFTTPAR